MGEVVYGVDFQRSRILTIDEQDVLRQAVVPEDTSPCETDPSADFIWLVGTMFGAPKDSA